MTNIIDLPTKTDPSADADAFFNSIIYRDDLIDLIDTILAEHNKRLEHIAKEHGDITEDDLNQMTAILGFVDRIYEELPKDKYAA